MQKPVFAPPPTYRPTDRINIYRPPERRLGFGAKARLLRLPPQVAGLRIWSLLGALALLLMAQLPSARPASADQFTSSWGPWQLVDPTTTTRHPVATAVFGGRVFLFEVDTWDSRVWYNSTTDGSNWSAWSTAGGPPPVGTVGPISPAPEVFRQDNATPLAAVSYRNELHLFAVGTDDLVYDTISRDGATWSAWHVLSNEQVYYGPVATVFNDRLYLFFVNKSYAVVSQFSVNGVAWQGQQVITTAYETPLNLYSTPAATVYNGQLHVFAVGADYQLREKISGDGATWSWWQAIGTNGLPNFGGPILASPAAITTTIGNKLAVRVFANGPVYEPGGCFGIGCRAYTDGVNENTSTGAGWTGWYPLPPEFCSIGGPAVVAFSGRLYLFGERCDGTIWETIYQ